MTFKVLLFVSLLEALAIGPGCGSRALVEGDRDAGADADADTDADGDACTPAPGRFVCVPPADAGEGASIFAVFDQGCCGDWLDPAFAMHAGGPDNEGEIRVEQPLWCETPCVSPGWEEGCPGGLDLTSSAVTAPLEPGTYRVTSGGSEVCRLDVRDWTTCSANLGGVIDVVMPRLVLVDYWSGFPARIPLTIRAEASGGCDCEPVLRPLAGDPPRTSLEACGCCVDCDCEDEVYEVNTVLHGPVEPGDYVLDLPGGPQPLAVRTYCEWLSIDSLEVRSPAAYGSISGERFWWVRAGIESADTCATALAIRTQSIEAGTVTGIELGASACSVECSAGEEPGPVRAWHNLGPLEPGRYRVFTPAPIAVGQPPGEEVAVEFVVP